MMTSLVTLTGICVEQEWFFRVLSFRILYCPNAESAITILLAHCRPTSIEVLGYAHMSHMCMQKNGSQKSGLQFQNVTGKNIMLKKTHHPSQNMWSTMEYSLVSNVVSKFLKRWQNRFKLDFSEARQKAHESSVALLPFPLETFLWFLIFFASFCFWFPPLFASFWFTVFWFPLWLALLILSALPFFGQLSA